MFTCKRKLELFCTIQTFFLDCNSNIFTWENPNSFVVVAPRRVAGASDDTGGAFAKSLINILRAEKKRLQLLTVQSLVDKMQADLYDL